MKVSDEIRLLLHCIQLQPKDNIIQEIDALASRSINWKRFTDAALWHGVAPLAYNGLRHCQARNGVPAEYFEKLKSIYRENLIRNTIMFSEFEKIAGVLGKSNIPMVALKGAGFAKMIYKDIGLRPMSDIDILVKPQDLDEAIQAVNTIGYRQCKGERLEHILKNEYHFVVINPETNVLLEIHWDISCKRHPSLVRSKVDNLTDIWWSRVSTANSESANVFHLNPVDLICLVSVHFFKHRFINRNAGFSSTGSLLQLCDILNIIRFYQNEITWDELKAKSQRISLYSVVSVVMWIVKNVFFDFFQESDSLFKDLSIEPSEKTIAQYVAKRILAIKDKDTRIPIGLINKPKNVSLSWRIADIFQKVFPNPPTLSKKLNRPIDSKWFYLNYLYRTFFLFKKYGKVWFHKQDLREEDALRRWINELG